MPGCDRPSDDRADADPRGDRGPGQPQLIERVRDEIDDGDIEPIAAAPAVSTEMYALGQALAFDKILSGNENISCLTCHHPSIGSDDDRALPRGEGGSGLGHLRTGGPIVPRNAPALFNLHTYETMFWDSRVSRQDGRIQTPAGDHITPEMVAVFDHGIVSAQAMFPVTSREEMRGQPGDNELADIPDGDFTAIWAALMNRLGGVPSYVQMFEAAYPGTQFDDMTFAHAANAIAAFEIAGFESRDSPWERFVAGDDDALSDDELEGALLFFDNCARCHSGSAFSDFRHHNTGLAQLGPGKGDGPSGADDFGREQVTGNQRDRWAFRTPPLFNVELTGPFGHAGQFAELRDHIAHYVDPAGSLRRYDVTEHVDEEALWSMVLDNTEAIIATISRRTGARLGRGGNGVTSIEIFLETLTADSATDLSPLVPSSVPSGLPVAD
ncbi:MAG: cytochrome-c peroxidase [Deltaproteobacteria bacterium]|nr:cytochrome-c peroxidase [Deltaproteobacteria bacterium]